MVKWTQDIADEIIERIAKGEAVTDICQDDWLGSEVTFYRKLDADKDLFERYTRAREIQAHREADEIRKIADESRNEDYNVAKLRIDARKWRASKLAPKHYGDKLDLAVTNTPLSEEAIDAAITAKLATMAAK